MTVGIAVYGPGAARAALAGLEAVEAVGRGAIGGFVSLSVLLEDGTLFDLGTQRGGAQALLALPGFARTRGARHAVLMSSGPDRPDPLSQFTPGDPAVGLLTGHRLPNMAGPDGHPPNLVALTAMGAGASPSVAIETALSADPELDAGLIAMNLAGDIALLNSASVGARDDIGAAHFTGDGIAAAVLHNTIFPHHALADLAVSAIRDSMAPGDAAPNLGTALGQRVHPGPCRALLVGSGGIEGFEAPGAQWQRPEWEGCPVRRGDPAMAGGEVVGRVVAEAYCILRDGTVTGTRGSDAIGWTEEEPA
ncbi:DUF6963 family protein [Marinibacterium profundimaris]|uniref:Beta-ketoacyl synthase N-terminal domain-containing protein n=1 Tax=Marinibacterium profundimaris TaxID=1679460 RepID=A0A225NTJ8_9RHOB|nr:hypothetical protein [Marinibacterium profundimaris]OWU74930.1 hypothetical protein ATO3_10245 [Marinibacterium profundimaris]